jgi:hypothetical protein
MLGSLPNTGVTVTTVAPGGIVAAAASKDAQTVSRSRHRLQPQEQ